MTTSNEVIDKIMEKIRPNLWGIFVFWKAGLEMADKEIEKILTKHFQPTEDKVEKLIDKYQNRLDHPVSNDPNEKNNIDWFIQDLHSLLPK